MLSSQSRIVKPLFACSEAFGEVFAQQIHWVWLFARRAGTQGSLAHEPDSPLTRLSQGGFRIGRFLLLAYEPCSPSGTWRLGSLTERGCHRLVRPAKIRRPYRDLGHRRLLDRPSLRHARRNKPTLLQSQCF